jgi:hypothetical protein
LRSIHSVELSLGKLSLESKVMLDSETTDNLPSNQLSKAGLERSPLALNNPTEIVQEFGLALYKLGHFMQGTLHYRNQILGLALDPTQTQAAPHIIETLIDSVTSEIGLVVSDRLVTSAEPISGWDFSTPLADTATSIFEAEFVERVNYILEAIAQDNLEAASTPNAKLLAVDRLDLIIALSRSEIQRLAAELERLAQP